MNCKKSGTKLDAYDRFCSSCGTRTYQDLRSKDYPKVSYSQNHSVSQKEPADKLFCELAYVGTLFWLPLLFCPNSKRSRYCANQGLWILILSVLACWFIQLAGMIRDLFVGGIGSVLAGGIYSFLLVIFLFFMIYLAFNAFRNVMSIHRGEKPQPIMFFDERAIIKEKGKVL